MARSSRIIKDNANYHIMSRTNAKAFLFNDGRLKSSIVSILKRVAVFSGVKLHAYCVMDDHFHVVCNVSENYEPLSENVVLERIGVLKGRMVAEAIRNKLVTIKKDNAYELVEEELNRWRKRMGNVSEFTKTFKELVNIIYKKHHPYCGSIWSGRFKSTIIESGEYLRNCIRYVEFNPVRARMVHQAKDYCWSSRNDTLSGSVPAEGDWVMKRWAQIGNGKILGSKAFVEIEIGINMQAFNSTRVKARQVMGITYAAYGYRLADRCA